MVSEDKKKKWFLKNNFSDEQIVFALQGIVHSTNEDYRIFNSECGYGIYKVCHVKRVMIIVAGGAGEGPMWAGLVADGLADAAIFGEKNCAPNAFAMYEMGKRMNAGEGVLFLVNNYMGDYLNTDLAVEMLSRDGIKAQATYSTDNMYSAIGEVWTERGGLHGIGQLCKMARALSDNGEKLEYICNAMKRQQMMTASCSVLYRNNKVFVGEGFSGEPAYKEMDVQPIEQTVYYTADALLCDILTKRMDNRDIEKQGIYISLNHNRSVTYMEAWTILEIYERWGRSRGFKNCRGYAGCYFDVFGEEWGWSVSFVLCNQAEYHMLLPVCGHGFTI